jgi:sporulation-control protein spo0M
MGFSEKMRDSLGAEGARLDVRTPADAITAGGSARVSVVIVGGSKPAAVDALVVRLFEACRHWIDATGATLTEDEAQGKTDAGLVPNWTKTMLAEQRLDVGTTVEPGQRHEVEIVLAVPESTSASSPACTHTVLAQADIKGQIDPTGQARLSVVAAA